MLSKKHKLIGIAAAALCATAVFGVGYSAWSITAEPVALTAGVTVETLSTSGVVFTAALGTNQTFRYGAPSVAGSNTYSWLSFEPYTSQENFTVNVDVTIPVLPGAGNIVITTAVDSAHKTAYDACVTANYLKSIATVTTPIASFTANTALTIDVVQEWGTAFNSSNPYNYFNNVDQHAIASGTTTYGEMAQTALKAIYAFSGATFTITVTYATGS